MVAVFNGEERNTVSQSRKWTYFVILCNMCFVNSNTFPINSSVIRLHGLSILLLSMVTDHSRRPASLKIDNLSIGNYYYSIIETHAPRLILIKCLNIVFNNKQKLVDNIIYNNICNKHFTAIYYGCGLNARRKIIASRDKVFINYDFEGFGFVHWQFNFWRIVSHHW